jgi:hypothetical protein
MKKLLLSLTTLCTVAAVGLAASPVFAANPFQDVCNIKGAGNSALCQEQTKGQQNPLVGPTGILRVITGIVALIAGISAVIIILIAGASYIASGGDPAKVQSAKNSLVGVVVGLIIIALASSIISLVIGRL